MLIGMLVFLIDNDEPQSMKWQKNGRTHAEKAMLIDHCPEIAAMGNPVATQHAAPPLGVSVSGERALTGLEGREAGEIIKNNGQVSALSCRDNCD